MVGMPWKRPRGKFGTSQGHPGRLGRFMWKFTFKGQNVRRTDGTYDGTDGTCPRDRRDTHTHTHTPAGVPPTFFPFIVFFLFPFSRRTLRVMDIRAESNGRPHPKVFSCGPSDGEKICDPWTSGRKGQECLWEIQIEKFMFMLFSLS